MRARALALRADAPVPDGGRPSHHRARSGAARTGDGESGTARRVVDHPQPVRGPAADPARRGCAEPPPYPIGAALCRRRRRRVHRRRWRANHDASGRLHHHAVVDVSRSRQPGQGPGDLARWARHSAGGVLRRRLRRALSGGSAAGHARPKATRWRATAPTMLPLENTAGRAPRRYSATPMRAAARRWSSFAATEIRIRRTG